MSETDDRPTGEDLPPEGDEDELEDEEAGEAEPAAEAEAIRSHEEAEAAELERAHRAYLDAVLYHYGDDAPISPCHLCEARGYLFVELAADPTAEACPACLGLGVTRTGSLVEGNATRPCPRCNGAGFVPKAGVVEPVAPEVERPVIPILPPSAFPPAPVELPPAEAV